MFDIYLGVLEFPSIKHITFERHMDEEYMLIS